MPDEGVDWMAPNSQLLSADEFAAVAKVARDIGIDHVKLTGGEPTLRSDIVEIVGRMKSLGFADVSLTTNATLLDRLAAPLREAGLDRLTVSCDSLRKDRYRAITNGGDLCRFQAGLRAALDAGFEKLKFNVVVIKGTNDDEVVDFAELALSHDWTIRFIEFMPLGDSVYADRADDGNVTLANEIVQRRIADRLGRLEPIEKRTEKGVGPAELFTFPGAVGRLGFISAMSQPFCETCNRLRLTAIGELRSCLFDGGEVDLLPAIRPAVDEARLRDLFEQCVVQKPEVHSGRGNRAMSQLGG